MGQSSKNNSVLAAVYRSDFGYFCTFWPSSQYGRMDHPMADIYNTYKYVPSMHASLLWLKPSTGISMATF